MNFTGLFEHVRPKLVGQNCEIYTVEDFLIAGQNVLGELISEKWWTIKLILVRLFSVKNIQQLPECPVRYQTFTGHLSQIDAKCSWQSAFSVGNIY